MYLPGLLVYLPGFRLRFTCQVHSLPVRHTTIAVLRTFQAAHADLATFARPSMAKSLTIPRRPSCAPLTHITNSHIRAPTMLSLSVSNCSSKPLNGSRSHHVDLIRHRRHVSDSAETPISHPMPLRKESPHTHEAFEWRNSARCAAISSLSSP